MEDQFLLQMMDNVHANCAIYNIVLVGDAMTGYEYRAVPNYTLNEVEAMYLETLNVTRVNLLEHPKISTQAYNAWVSTNVHMTRYEYQNQNQMGYYEQSQ